METKTLYIYNTKINNKIRRTVTLTRNEMLGEFIGTLTRLIADQGKVLTDGVNQATCIDTDNPEQWTEIDEQTPEEGPNE